MYLFALVILNNLTLLFCGTWTRCFCSVNYTNNQRKHKHDSNGTEKLPPLYISGVHLICAPCDSELYGYAPASYNCASWVWVNTLHYQFTFLSIFLKRKLFFMFYYATKKVTRVRLHRCFFFYYKALLNYFSSCATSLGLC